MNPALSQLAVIRRNNLRRLAEQHGALVLSERLGYASASFLSQMIGPNPSRDVSERTARSIEHTLDLEPGWMDLDLEDYSAREA